MHFGQKLAFFGLGCAFVVLGQAAVSLLSATAAPQGGQQSAEFDTVTVRTLRVVDAAGVPCAILADAVEVESGGVSRHNVVRVFDDRGSNVLMIGYRYWDKYRIRQVELFAEDGKAGALVTTAADGGAVVVSGNDGTGRVQTIAQPGRGSVDVFSNDLRERARMSVWLEGAAVEVSGPDGKLRAYMTGDVAGGGLGLFGEDGRSSAQMSVSPVGGGLAVVDDDTVGVLRRELPGGGQVAVIGHDGKVGAAMSVREAGGQVYTWGRDGAKTGNLP